MSPDSLHWRRYKSVATTLEISFYPELDGAKHPFKNCLKTGKVDVAGTSYLVNSCGQKLTRSLYSVMQAWYKI